MLPLMFYFVEVVITKISSILAAVPMKSTLEIGTVLSLGQIILKKDQVAEGNALVRLNQTASDDVMKDETDYSFYEYYQKECNLFS